MAHPPDNFCTACCLLRQRDFIWHEKYNRENSNEPSCPDNPCCDCCSPRVCTSVLCCCNWACGWTTRVVNNCQDLDASCKESPGKGWCHWYLSGCGWCIMVWPIVVSPVWWPFEAALLCKDCGEAHGKSVQLKEAHRRAAQLKASEDREKAAQRAAAERAAAPLADSLQSAAQQLQRGRAPPERVRELLQQALAGKGGPAALASLGGGADPLVLAALRELLPEVCLPPELLRLLLRAAFPVGAAAAEQRPEVAVAALLNAAASFGPRELQGLVLEEVRPLVGVPATAAAPAQQRMEATAPRVIGAPAGAATLSRLAGCPVTRAALALLEPGSGLDADLDKGLEEAAARELHAALARSPPPEYYFLDADKVRRWSAREPLPRFQEALKRGLLVKLPVQPELALAGAFRRSCLVVSHRWMKPGVPDTDGSQLQALRRHLDKDKEVRFVWQDWSCMPQGGEKTEEEKAYFKKALRDVNLLYLSMKVLILLDASYQTRFWCIYESWCAMRSVRPSGLEPARDGERRWTVACLGSYADTAAENTTALEKAWHEVATEVALKKMRSDDIQVTNQSDKDEQIKKLQNLREEMLARWSGMKKAGWIELKR